MIDAYKKAGVDIDAGEALVRRIGPDAKSTSRRGSDASLGGFGGLFDLKAAGFADPILIAGTDGVGTKLIVAQELNQLRTIGIDLVAMCANDVLAQGAEPLFFLDYFATGALDVDAAAEVIGGVAEGCRQAGCALIGGETAEMPGLYKAGEFDLAGFCVGAVERDQLLPREARVGDMLVALGSSGPHANGFSLIRKIIENAGVDYADEAPFLPGTTLGDAVLAPTRIYVRSVLPLLSDDCIRGFAHITGGGLIENVPRVLPKGLTARFDDEQIRPSALFNWLRDVGQLTERDMRRTFNCGIGAILVVEAEASDRTVAALAAAGETAWTVGEVSRSAD
ncbi:MAG: phosphoribosylformylglycinamidine cyclo-ligase [Alphaproteobacteria bacterium]|nr:phosphoribosylformylglycinamidine cyclo-ligase [Alphaproteobacteria bacterium]